MKNKYYLFTGFIFLHIIVHAQVKIGDNSTTINGASLLELETTNKGLVFPRVSLSDVTSSSPLPSGLLTGTVIYNTNVSVTGGNGIGLYVWDGSQWFAITANVTSSAWGLTGNAGTNYSVNFLGTTDNISMRLRTNNVQRMIIDSLGRIGIGLSNPSNALSVLAASNPLYLSGVQATGSFTTDSLLTIKTGIVKKAPYSSLANNLWSLTGNSGTSYSTNFLGTKDNVSLRFRTNNVQRAIIDSVGNVGIGLSNPSYALSVLSAANPLYLSGVQATATFTTDSLLTIYNGVVKEAPFSSLTNNFWSLTGNGGTSSSTNFIGTTDAIDFVAKTNNTERIRILGAASGSSKAGWIGMGVTIPRSSLDVTGNFTNKNVITIQNTSSSGYSSVDMLDDAGTLKGTFGYGNSGTGSFFASRDYFSTYGSDFVLNANSGNYNFFMSGTSGNIGINTGTPGATLDVNGNFKLGSSGTVLTNVYKTSVSITIPTSAALFSVSRTVAVSNAPLNSSVIVNPRSALPAGVNIAYSYVSSANNVTINFTGVLAVVSTLVTFDITVLY